jgi:hypothetical protein
LNIGKRLSNTTQEHTAPQTSVLDSGKKEIISGKLRSEHARKLDFNCKRQERRQEFYPTPRLLYFPE